MMVVSKDMNALYGNALERATETLVAAAGGIDEVDTAGIIRQCVFYGVRYINSLPKLETIDGQRTMARYRIMEQIMAWMGMLTYCDLVNLFPPAKVYDGERTGCKDYLYTMDFLKLVDLDAPTGDPRGFLMEYYNPDILKFSLRLLGAVDDLRRSQGQLSIAEEWAYAHGVRTLHLYEGPGGKQYTVDSQGKSKPVRKARPRHLRILSSCQPPRQIAPRD